MIFSRNIAGYGPNDYQTFLDWMRTGGSRVARIQLDSLGMGYTPTGALDQNWAAQWDRIFDSARAEGVYVMPVFGVWYDWNDGNGYSTWKSNPFNEINGGPAKTPAESVYLRLAHPKIMVQLDENAYRTLAGARRISLHGRSFPK